MCAAMTTCKKPKESHGVFFSFFFSYKNKEVQDTGMTRDMIKNSKTQRLLKLKLYAPFGIF